MTSWIIPIDRSFAAHWETAKKHGLWDMSKRFDITTGDLAYFWQAGGSLLAQTKVTAGPIPITSSTPTPWRSDDPRSYTTRFHFTTISEAPASQPTWSELTAELSKRMPPQAPRQFNGDDEAILAGYFPTPDDDLSVGELALQDLLESELGQMGEDMREYDWRAVARRRGQARFHDQLVVAYDGRCAATGTRAAEVLEAAHISRFRGDHTNHGKNGLLLRADLHTLFDLYLLTVTPEYTLRVHPELPDPYSALDGTPIRLPVATKDLPSQALLTKHNLKCAWLSL